MAVLSSNKGFSRVVIYVAEKCKRGITYYYAIRLNCSYAISMNGYMDGRKDICIFVLWKRSFNENK